jgi:hypothetical protein
VSTVRSTLSGAATGAERKAGAIRYAVDFVGPDLANADLPKAALSATAGKVSEPVVVRNPSTRGVRVDFILTPDMLMSSVGGSTKTPGSLVSEVWLSDESEPGRGPAPTPARQPQHALLRRAADMPTSRSGSAVGHRTRTRRGRRALLVLRQLSPPSRQLLRGLVGRRSPRR